MAEQGTRVETLLDEFEAACRDLEDTIERVPDDRWQAPTPGDGRQVNVVAHHAAAAHRYIAGMVQAMAAGQPASVSSEQIDLGNAQHARQFAGCSKTDVLETHRQAAAEATAMLRGLTDEQLASTGELLIGRRLTVEQAIRGVLIGHPRAHAGSIRAALA